MAMLFGVHPLPPAEAIPPRTSHNDTASGYAIIQRGTGEDATWLCVKYGPSRRRPRTYSRQKPLHPLHPKIRPLPRRRHPRLRLPTPHGLGQNHRRPQHPHRRRKIPGTRRRKIPSPSAQATASTTPSPTPALSTKASTSSAPPHSSTKTSSSSLIKSTSDAEHTFDLTYHQAGEWKDLPRGDDLDPTRQNPRLRLLPIHHHPHHHRKRHSHHIAQKSLHQRISP